MDTPNKSLSESSISTRDFESLSNVLHERYMAPKVKNFMSDSVELITSSINYQNAITILKYATKYKLTALQEAVIDKIGPEFEVFFAMDDLLAFADKDLVKIILTHENFNYNEQRMALDLIGWLKEHPEYRFLVENLKGPTISLIIDEMNKNSQLLSPHYDNIRKSLIKFLNETEPQYQGDLISSHQTTYFSPNHISPADGVHSPINKTPFKSAGVTTSPTEDNPTLENHSPQRVNNTQLTQPESQLSKEEELFEETTTFASPIDLQSSFEEKSMIRDPPKFLKLLVVGAPQSGKTSYIRRLILNEVVDEYKPTVGVEIFPCKISYITSEKSPDHNVKINIWDVAGRDDLSGDRNTFYYGADLLLIFADSPHKAQQWKQEVFATLGVDGIPTIVAAPKLYCSSEKRDLYEPIGDLLRLYFASDRIQVVLEEEEDQLENDVNLSPISDPGTPSLITTPPQAADKRTESSSEPIQPSETTDPSTDNHTPRSVQL